jgi:hypothetical protein
MTRASEESAKEGVDSGACRHFSRGSIEATGARGPPPHWPDPRRDGRHSGRSHLPTATERGRSRSRSPSRTARDRAKRVRRDAQHRPRALPARQGSSTTGAVAERTGSSVTVRCGGCGDVFQLSVRNEYEHRRKGTTPKCQICRRPPKPLTRAERERYRAWWLEESGLSRRELHEIAVGLVASAL